MIKSGLPAKMNYDNKRRTNNTEFNKTIIVNISNRRKEETQKKQD